MKKMNTLSDAGFEILVKPLPDKKLVESNKVYTAKTIIARIKKISKIANNTYKTLAKLSFQTDCNNVDSILSVYDLFIEVQNDINDGMRFAKTKILGELPKIKESKNIKDTHQDVLSITFLKDIAKELQKVAKEILAKEFQCGVLRDNSAESDRNIVNAEWMSLYSKLNKLSCILSDKATKLNKQANNFYG